MSAGLFVVSALISLVAPERFERLARIAALVAPYPVAVGCLLLIFDLGSPLRFWRLFSTIQLTSPMSIGSWLLTLFTGVAFLYMLLWAFPRQGKTLGIGGLKLTLPDESQRSALRRMVAVAGIPMGLGVGIYTGVLLGAIPARPFWNTPMVAMLFLFSALSTAAALLMLLSMRRADHLSVEQRHAEQHLLAEIDIVIILFEILLVVPYLLHNALSTASQAHSIDLILGGPYTLPFWIGFIGIGLLGPLMLEGAEIIPRMMGRLARPQNTLLIWMTGVQVLVGGLVLRWVFVFAGQESHFG